MSLDGMISLDELSSLGEMISLDGLGSLVAQLFTGSHDIINTVMDKTNYVNLDFDMKRVDYAYLSKETNMLGFDDEIERIFRIIAPSVFKDVIEPPKVCIGVFETIQLVNIARISNYFRKSVINELFKKYFKNQVIPNLIEVANHPSRLERHINHFEDLEVALKCW
jgi:hypothetical protein